MESLSILKKKKNHIPFLAHLKIFQLSVTFIFTLFNLQHFTLFIYTYFVCYFLDWWQGLFTELLNSAG